MNIRACAKTLEPSAHTQSACCQLPTSWQSAPHLLDSLLSSPDAWGPAHPLPLLNPLSRSPIPSVKGWQPSCFHSVEGGIRSVHVLLWPSAPSGSLGLGPGRVEVGHVHLGCFAARLGSIFTQRCSTTTVWRATRRVQASCPLPVQVPSKSWH